MPVLELLLTNSALTCSAERGEEEWILAPDVALQRNHERFDVLLGQNVHDGFGLQCSLRIKQRTPQNSASMEKLARLALEASNGKLNANLLRECVGTIAVAHWPEEGVLPQFEIIVLVSADTFYRVQHSSEKYACRMSLKIDAFEAGLMHGDDPDGGDLKWFVDKVEVAVIESMSMQFMPR